MTFRWRIVQPSPRGAQVEGNQMTKRKANAGAVTIAAAPVKKSAPKKNTPDEMARDNENKRLVADLQTHQIELESQNDELKQTRGDLEDARDRYRDLFDLAPIGYFTVSGDGLVLEANLTGAGMAGSDRQFLIGRPFSKLIDPGDRDIYFSHLNKLAKGANRESWELRMLSGEGSQFYAWFEAIAIRDQEGGLLQARIAITDITGRRRTEQQIRELLREKDLLMQEIHHRVKNNLITILSLLTLHREKMVQKEAQDVLGELTNRLQSMMILYDTLARSGSYGSVNARHYLVPLIEEMVKSCPGNNCLVHIESAIEDFDLPAKKALTAGMIINELVMNAFKYAYPAGGGGEVRVALRGAGEGNILLQVADDGAGMPGGAAVQSGIGLRMVNAFVKQLRGELSMETGNGTRYAIVFPAG
ncbi:MAG: PAS domain S-box protein [Spirochaetes bacterium]|nr:MAG: PAS domain S-box protein [Spirochaetota bacterium]